jgi:hypothetical protein
MKIYLKKLSVVVLIFLMSLILLSTNVLAAGKNQPWLDYSGSFRYTNSDSSYSLSLYGITISGVKYIDGTYETDIANDPILGASIYIGTLYNSPSPDNLHFDDTAGAGGGAVTFEIKDDSYTYLTATLDPFDVTTADPWPFAYMNSTWILDNINNVTINPNGDAPNSRYLSELKTRKEPANLNITFTFGSTPYDFTADSWGSIQGTLAAGPEPVSSILFVIGSAPLAFRCYRRQKRKQASNS